MIFFSVDWGTTNCRVKLVKVNRGEVTLLGGEQTSMGISEVYNGWLERPGADRSDYYLTRLRPCLEKIMSELRLPVHTLQETPIVISGMAGSSIGIAEIPYSTVPFELDPPKINLKTLEALSNPQIMLFSGLRTDGNIMRGEETQLIGCWQHDLASERKVFIFPGTHSKHIVVTQATVRDFKTFITGELLSLLTNFSTIKTNVVATAPGDMDVECFKSGLLRGSETDLLEDIFTVRCNEILNKFTKLQNYDFLTGLLLGHELKYLSDNDEIVLCAGVHLAPVYTLALELLGLIPHTTVISPDIVEQSAILGQYKILKQLNS